MKRQVSLGRKVLFGLGCGWVGLAGFYFLFPCVWQDLTLRMPGDTFYWAEKPIDFTCAHSSIYKAFLDKQHAFLYPPKSVARLTQAQAAHLAAMMPYPPEHELSVYAYGGRAIYFDGLRQWAVSYEPTTSGPVPLGGGGFAIWLDDRTGQFVRYSFSY